MKSKVTKILLASSLALGCMMPAMANFTTIQLDATIAEVLVLQIENSANGAIMSGDDLDPTPGSPNPLVVGNMVLDFGTVDAYAVGAGTLTATAGTVSGVLNKQIVSAGVYQDEATYDTTLMAAPATDGAVYFIENTGAAGYQLRGLRTGGLTIDVDVDVSPAVAAGGALDAIVAPAATNFTAGTAMAGKIILNASPVTLNAALAHNVAMPLDIGLFVPISATAGLKQSLITFYGT